MKFKNKATLFLFLTSSFVIGGISSFNKEPVESNAYSTLSSTMDINLNDLKDDSIRSYYSALSSKTDESELRGTNLLKNLKPILRNNFKYYQYDSVWKIYEITDRDWSLSPASASTVGTYDSSTNYLYSYKYGEKVSTPTGDNPYVRALYRDQSNEKRKIRAWDAHSSGTGDKSNGYLNREHVWPKSYGFSKTTKSDGTIDTEAYKSGPAGTDVHHLMAADNWVNSELHSNYFYGNVETVSKSGQEERATEANLLGTSVHSEVTATNIFEPLDQHKGDIARAIFYMCAMYNSYDGSTPTDYDPNLALSSNPTYIGQTTIASTIDSPATYGILQDLLEWNKLDPVDEFEIHRNNLIFNNYQFNRNPFIDFPEWADLIWGDKNSAGNYAKPDSDVINDKNSSVSISLDKTAISLTVDDTTTITATCDGTASWSISSSDIISLSGSGNTQTITALNSGTATITAFYNDESVSCVVTVKDKEVVLSVDKNSISLDVDETETITANKEATWSISPTNIASLSSTSGASVTISALAKGNATISVSDGTTTLTCSVVVTDSSAPIDSETKDVTISPGTTFLDGKAYPVGSSASLDCDTYQESETRLKFGISGIYRQYSTYIMFKDGSSPYIYNCDNLSKIDKISLTFRKGSAEAGKYGVYFSNSVLSTYDTSSNKTIPSCYNSDQTVEVTNDNNYGYFQISTSSANVRLASITITYTSYTAENFANNFLDTMNCDSSGIKKADESNWEKTKTLFNRLNNAEQEILKNTSANINGTTKEQCIHQYEYIVRKYSYENYMSRDIPTSSLNTKNNDDKLYSSIIVSIIILSCGLIAVSSLYYYKKKKTN